MHCFTSLIGDLSQINRTKLGIMVSSKRLLKRQKVCRKASSLSCIALITTPKASAAHESLTLPFIVIEVWWIIELANGNSNNS